MSKQQYQLTVSEDQLKVINIALEQYFRVHMGQFFDLSDSLATLNYPSGISKDRERFDEMLARRDVAKELLEHAYRIAIGGGYLEGQSHEMLIVQDIWQVIRYCLAETRGADPDELRWMKPLIREDGCRCEKVEGIK